MNSNELTVIEEANTLAKTLISLHSQEARSIAKTRARFEKKRRDIKAAAPPQIVKAVDAMLNAAAAQPETESEAAE